MYAIREGQGLSVVYLIGQSSEILLGRNLMFWCCTNFRPSILVTSTDDHGYCLSTMECHSTWCSLIQLVARVLMNLIQWDILWGIVLGNHDPYIPRGLLCIVLYFLHDLFHRALWSEPNVAPISMRPPLPRLGASSLTTPFQISGK